ncbi:hypothetical protein KCU83_g364, partial [Aureobasidium melanogenum]
MLTDGKVLYAAITSSNRPLLHSAMNSSLFVALGVMISAIWDDLAELKNLGFRHDCAFVGRVQRGVKPWQTSRTISQVKLFGPRVIEIRASSSASTHIRVSIYGEFCTQGTGGDKRPSQFDRIAVVVLQYRILVSDEALLAVVPNSISLSWCSLAILTGTILSPSTLISRSASCLMSPRKALFLNFEFVPAHHHFADPTLSVLDAAALLVRSSNLLTGRSQTLIQRALALLHLPLLERHDPFETAAPTDVIDVHSPEMFVEPLPPELRQSLTRVAAREKLKGQESRRVLRDVLSRARVFLLEEVFKPVSIVSRTRNVFGLQMIRLGPLPKQVRVRGKKLFGRSIYVNTTISLRKQGAFGIVQGR